MGAAPLDVGFGPGVAPDLGGGSIGPSINAPMTSVGTTDVDPGFARTSGDDIYGDNPATFGRASGENDVLTSVAKDAGLDTTGLTTADAEGSTTTLEDINNTLLELLNSQNVNNRIGKKQQRAIEGMEI